ncbi:hypothetical protein LAZ67_2006889 [Cordylochernes scorpioides]|uniref:Endonuclease/exonuclease/phosphatase domain-containing protein n=1 Tax=Cordylochernes scorpioides TaxID=51811 RepID=A0ABY6K5Q0_9ARAC|nr:hypothetical protein LAZ67_2006889 [Cordylochernes scorpioides]
MEDAAVKRTGFVLPNLWSTQLNKETEDGITDGGTTLLEVIAPTWPRGGDLSRRNMEMSTPANSTNLAILGLHPSAYKVRRTPLIKAKWDADGARGSERMWGQQTHGSWANCNDSHVLLATARIKIKNGLGKLCTCRALLDSGSQVTMITKGCCERLGLVQRKSDRMIIGVGNTPVQHSSSTVSVTFCPLNNSEEFSVEAVVTGVLTSEIPNFRLKDPNWPTLKSLKLADPEFYIQAPIDMILGADIYTELMLNGSISLGEGLPMAINTRLGWVLLGKLMGTSESNTEVCNLSLQSEPELEFVMKRFWEIESVPSPDLCTQDEDCERQHRPLLGESREKALRRFLSLEGKLCKNVKLYDQYRGFMKEYEHLNHMERVPIAEVKRELCRCCYMPHHPEDADYQRILWRPSPEEPVVDYLLLTVTYGTTSAPFLAMRTVQQLAEDEGQNYPEASRVTLNDFYVDDLLTGAQTIAEAKELIDQLKDLMKRGGFHLRKWNSNCQEIVSHVEEMNEERKINLEKGAISKILGIVWDHVQDTFKVNITLPEEVVTKRDLLSNIARIFDPIGFLSPTTVAMANLQRQTAVKEVEDLEGLPVYHRAILKENGEWPEVTKAIQCSYPKVFVGDGTHLYLLIEDVESLDGPNVRSETKLNQNLRFNIKDYTTLRMDRPGKFEGGLAVLIKTLEIKFKEIAYNQSKPREGTTEAQAIEIYLTGLIETLSEASSDIAIILGDFNAERPTWGSPVQDNKCQQVEDMLTDLDLTPLNNEKNTYLSKSTGTESAIDITAINYNIAPTTQWKILKSAISDHRLILTTLKFKIENFQQNRRTLGKKLQKSSKNCATKN